jgi:hypothetical protein
MQRLALVLALCGCASAQRHPAIAIGIVGAVIGGLACEMNDPANQSTCAIIAAAAGAGLGGITGLVTLFADTSDHSIPGDEDMEMEGSAVRLHTRTLPPPEPIIDGGVDAGSASTDATIDAAQGAPSSAL